MDKDVLVDDRIEVNNFHFIVNLFIYVDTFVVDEVVNLYDFLLIIEDYNSLNVYQEINYVEFDTNLVIYCLDDFKFVNEPYYYF